MRHTRWSQPLAVLLASAAALCAAAAPASASLDPLRAPTDTAIAYLQARGAAVTAADPAATLAPWLGSDNRLSATEAAIACGTARRAAAEGHAIDTVSCSVTVTATAPAADGSVDVRAHVVTTTAWHTDSGEASTEASGVDHTVTLMQSPKAWAVTADAYDDVSVPACLEAADAPAADVRAAEARLSQQASPPLPLSSDRHRGARRKGSHRYNAIIVYDREACRDNADKYALSHNPTFVHFNADCANFASQCGRAGGMQLAFGGTSSGWWYDKNGTSNPSDDAYSLSWINVGRQTSYWNLRDTDFVSSISGVGKGDFVYYDWSGDGTWDHVAVLVGTNAAGQKVIDAHSTDHYRVFWKLGTSATHYKFAHVRTSWIV